MVVLGIVSNDNNATTASRADLPKVFKERMECHGVEPFLFSLEDQFPIAQPDSSKVTHTLSCWVVQQYRILLLRGYPHHATRSILLKMNLIGRPEVYSWICRELSKFFYMLPELQDQPGQSEDVVCAGENQGI